MVKNPKIFLITPVSEPCIDLMDLPIPSNIICCLLPEVSRKSLPVLQIPLPIIPGHWSVFGLHRDFSFLFCCCQFEQPIADSNQRAILDWKVFQYCPTSEPLGDSQLPCELGPVFILAHLFPLEGSLLLVLLFLLTEEVFMWGIGGVVLGYPTIPEGPLPTLLVVWPSSSRASYLL